MKNVKVVLSLALILCMISSGGFARTATQSPVDATTHATPKLSPEEVVITGKIVCLGCHLKKTEQAGAQCSVYGHKNALLVEKVYDAKGASVEGAKGTIHQFLHNDTSDDLINNHALVGRRVVITGKIYPAARVIEVSSAKESQ